MLAKKPKIQEPKVAKTKSKSSFTRRKNHFLDLLEDAIAANHREIRDSRKLLNEAQERVIDIDPSLSVRNFGVWFDSHLSMSRHVTKLCNSSFYHLHNIRCIRKYLSRDYLLALIHAFITVAWTFATVFFMVCPSHRMKQQELL